MQWGRLMHGGYWGLGERSADADSAPYQHAPEAPDWRLDDGRTNPAWLPRWRAPHRRIRTHKGPRKREPFLVGGDGLSDIDLEARQGFVGAGAIAIGCGQRPPIARHRLAGLIQLFVDAAQRQQHRDALVA